VPSAAVVVGVLGAIPLWRSRGRRDDEHDYDGFHHDAPPADRPRAKSGPTLGQVAACLLLFGRGSRSGGRVSSGLPEDEREVLHGGLGEESRRSDVLACRLPRLLERCDHGSSCTTPSASSPTRRGSCSRSAAWATRSSTTVKAVATPGCRSIWSRVQCSGWRSVASWKRPVRAPGGRPRCGWIAPDAPPRSRGTPTAT